MREVCRESTCYGSVTPVDQESEIPTQRPSRYDEDLRFLPASDEDSEEKLLARADKLMRAVVSGGASRWEVEKKAQ